MANAADGGHGWSAEQRANANTIISVGLKMGMSWRDIQIGLMTAMQESSLRNLSYGDRDSAGLFQQRPSCGWGTFAQVTDPQYAAHKFFSTLAGVKNRGSMSLAQAAQAVQRSAYPDAYAKWTAAALNLVTGARKDGPKITPGSSPTVNPGDLAIPQDQGFDPSALMTPTVTQTATANDALAATDKGRAGAPGLASPLAGVPQSSGTGSTGSMADLTSMTPFANQADYQQATGGGQFGQKGVDGTRKALTEYARQFVGTPYVWGGNNLNSGVDCSGFVQQVFKHFGVNLPRISYQQVNTGTRIGLGKLRAGDLVGWDENTRNPGADHVAIYLGGGLIIEAPRPGVGVRIRRLDPHGYDSSAWGSRLHY